MGDYNDDIASCSSLCTISEDNQASTLLSVSVTFKPPGRSESNDKTLEKEWLENLNQKENIRENTAQLHTEESISDNIAACSTLQYMAGTGQVQKEGGTNFEDLESEAISGWKSYSNSIYIQPIIVSKSTNYERCGSTRLRKLMIAEESKKRTQQQQASDWITKHNQRLQSRGSLRTGEIPVSQTTHSQDFSRCSSSTQSRYSARNRSYCCQEDVRPASRIVKGFVCKSWAQEFLPKRYESHNHRGTDALTVRPYITASKPVRGKSNKISKHEEVPSCYTAEPHGNTNELKAQKTEREKKSRNVVSTENTTNICSAKKTEPEGNFTSLIFQNLSVNVTSNSCRSACSCREQVNSIHSEIVPKFLGKERLKSRSGSKSCIERKKQMSNVHFKEFPPINPLQELELKGKLH